MYFADANWLQQGGHEAAATAQPDWGSGILKKTFRGTTRWQPHGSRCSNAEGCCAQLPQDTQSMTDQKKVVSSDDRLGSVKVQIRSDDGVVPAEAVAAAGYIRKNAGIGAAPAQRPVRRNARSFLTSMQCL